MAEPSTGSFAAVKIKSEKVDPEVEQKIQILEGKIKLEKELHQKGSSTEAREPVEDKKAVEPVKSSNEILAELFQVFNAAPPEEILDDKSLLKKHKKHKKEKKKKSKKSTDGDLSDISADSAGKKSTDSAKRKHKKKKKHKHKEDKDREKVKEKDKEKSGYDETAATRKVKLEDADKRSKAKTTTKVTASVSISVSSSGRHENPAKKHKRHVTVNGSTGPLVKVKSEPTTAPRSKRNDAGSISEISLSDEETYLKEREQIEHQQSSKARQSADRPAKRPRRNSFYDGPARSRSRERDRQRNYDRHSRTARHSSRRGPSRSRSRSRSRDLGIDKKRLLEIARKNAISMFKHGNLPGCDKMTEEVKDKVLLKMRYGGRTVEDLTEFCKKISNGENLSDISSDEDSDCDKQGNPKAFHHPFQLKEREPIVMHIRNAKTILPRPVTEDQTKAITMQFPVSSGQQHRISEATWHPVPQKEPVKPLPALPAAVQSTSIFKNASAGVPAVPSTVPKKNVFQKLIPLTEQQTPAFRATSDPGPATPAVVAPPPPPPQMVPPTTPRMPAPPTLPPPTTQRMPAPPALPPILHSFVASCSIQAAQPPLIDTSLPPPMIPPPQQPVTNFVPDVPVPSSMPTQPGDSVFPQQNDFDVSSIISKRLYAMRRLQENPLDTEAMKLMRNSQSEITSWASSKHLPGQFTGSTGANVLRADELNSGPQVWARRDQLTNTKPVTGGMGMALLQKMGWKPGEGLGREKTGSLQPLLLDVKLDKRGLMAKEDARPYNMPPPPPKKRPPNRAEAMQQIQDKHPVCLLNEVTSKRKWTPPMYTLTCEAGPSHSRAFQFSVSVNGQTFTPSQVSNTKKDAKLLAARFCLQELGILT